MLLSSSHSKAGLQASLGPSRTEPRDRRGWESKWLVRVSQPLLWARGPSPALGGGAEAGWSVSMTYGNNVTEISDSCACETEESSLAFI